MAKLGSPDGKAGSGTEPASGQGPANAGHLMVGRAAELAVIDEQIAALGRARQVPVLAIVGEPGIGKSRLLTEVAARAEAASYLVLRGRAAEFEQNLPFGLLVDAMDHQLTSVDPGWFGRMPPEAVSELRHAFPMLPANVDDRPSLAAERYRTHRAVRMLLEDLAAERPLVLLLDDVHWADPASVELLGHLLRHPPVARVLIVLAFRLVPALPTLAADVATAVRDGRGSVLELAPLTASEAADLAGAHVSRAYLGQLYAESGGNPFFIEQLAKRGPIAQGSEAEAAGTRPAGVPTAVVAALNSELVGLSPAAQTMVRAAAVAGDPFDEELARAAADLEESAALAALDLLVERQLVSQTNDPRRFRFRHPILRRAIYESTGPGWRLAAHARIAAALAARGAAAPALAHHLGMSAHRGDEEAISVLVAAADSVASRAPANSARWYEAALRLLPDGTGASPRRLHLLVTAAMARWAAGELGAAHTHLLRALESAVPGTDTWLMVVSACAGVEALLGRHDQGRARLLDALRALGGEAAPAAVAIKLELSAAGAFSGDFAETRRWALDVLTSQDAPPPALVATATSLLAMAHAGLGENELAGRRLDEAVAAFDGLDDDAVAERIDNAHWLVLAEISLERFVDAVRHCERGIAVSRRYGRSDWMAGLMHCQVAALAWTGRLEEAGELAIATVDAACLAGYPLGLSVALWEQSVTACLAGDLVTAVRAAEEAVEAAAGLAPGVLTALPHLVLGRACLESGQPERARIEVLVAGGGPDLPLLVGISKPSVYETLTRTELAIGALDAADQWATRAESLLGEGSLPLDAAFAWRARAAVLLGEGDVDRAAELALSAAETASAAPIEEAKARILAGRALARGGARKEAIAQLERAQRTLDACGAMGYRDEAATELRRLGRRARRNQPYATGLHSLSDREREVADLVTAGMTNREIAARCFISEKTVEANLSSAFAKLGVSNRTALSREIAAEAGGSDRG